MDEGSSAATAPGKDYAYQDLVSACRKGAYPRCVVRTASGRLNYLLGLSRAQLNTLRQAAVEEGVGLILMGSRVSGPRLRQRSLHPILAACLPLKTERRAASALFPGSEFEIDKTLIKDYGPEDPRTSDLSVILVDAKRSEAEMRGLAAELEARFQGLGHFPVRFFARLASRYHRSEEEFLDTGRLYLRSLGPRSCAFAPEDLRSAMRELYLTLNLPKPLFNLGDLANGLAAAALLSASFSVGLGFHWVLPPTGFAFGFLGRYLARFRAWVAFSLGDGLWANAAALAADAALGSAVMGLILNPGAGLGLSWGAIVTGSVSHTLGKGSLRLWLDKRFSVGNDRRQGWGVLASALLNFLQGAVTSLVYAGSLAALSLQAGLCLLGLRLIFGPARRRSA